MSGRVPTIPELLPTYRFEALSRMADALGIKPRLTSRVRVTEQLVARFGSEEHVRQAVGSLDALARAVLERVQQVGGEVDAAALADTLVASGTVQPSPERPSFGSSWREPVSPVPGDPMLRGSRRFGDVVARLESRGLLLGWAHQPERPSLDLGLAPRYVVPEEVRPWLVPVAPRSICGRTPQGDVTMGDAAAFSRSLYGTWSYVWRVRPELLATTGLLAKRDWTAIAAFLPLQVDVTQLRREDEWPRLHFLRLMAEELALVAARGRRLTADERAATAHWRLPLAERAAAWFKAWCDGTWWPELAYLRGCTWHVSARGYADPAAPLVGSRRTILQWLAGAAAGNWIDLTALLEDLQLGARSFLVPETVVTSQFLSLGLRTNRYRSNRHGWEFYPSMSEDAAWDRVEGGFVAEVVQVLHWLGLADVADGPEGKLTAMRWTAIGRNVVYGDPLPEEEKSPPVRIVVQPTFQVLALGPLPEATMMELERFAEHRATDRAAEYVLTRESLYRGQQLGLTAAKVRERLEALSGAPLPQNVARSLSDWQVSHERITIRAKASLIQTSEDLLARLVKAEPAALRRLSPTVALVTRSGALTEALSVLELEALTACDPEGAGEVDMDKDGRVSARGKTHSLYVIGRLQRLADLDEGSGQWRVTRASARRATERHGLGAEAQVALWSALLGRPAPDWLVGRLKAWSGHYGEACVHRRLVVELANEAALAALESDPRLAGRLRRLQVKGPIVSVPADAEEVLADVLAEHGIDMKAPADD